ncbi:MAG: hypothetical protein JWR44_1082 [Hymenobacter sp.]|jgi:hypothetical protein|nr:hypothetical protein [Hymenobacter sp.]
MDFRTHLQAHGKAATGIEVPAEVVRQLAAGNKPKVRVTLNGHFYRSSIAVMGGKFMVGVSAENRAAAQVKAGDAVTVALELDNEVREVSIPDDFAAALAQDQQAVQFFDTLSYSNLLRHVVAIEQAKTAETRQRRIAKAVAALHEGQK